MVYSRAGSSDLFLILGCMTPTSCPWTFPLCILVLYGELALSSVEAPAVWGSSIIFRDPGFPLAYLGLGIRDS